MKYKVFCAILLVSLAACRGFVDTGPPVNMNNKVVFNVYSNSSDSCRCLANKFKIDTSLGFHCDVVDSVKISDSRSGKTTLEYTNEVGMTPSYELYGEHWRLYFIKKGIPGAYVNINFSPKAQTPIQGVGCDAYMRKSGIGIYDVIIVLKPKIKKGIKIIPYTGVTN
ncbi:MAG TPA: hypothetical protein VK783_15035 [Bacteroidia bacterium]|jgi:hypothetical protein|nr:hypothetical protein [Bacteroidia bacterium]